jgi:uncharacterized protein YktA (UPF0223 family)
MDFNQEGNISVKFTKDEIISLGDFFSKVVRTLEANINKLQFKLKFYETQKTFLKRELPIVGDFLSPEELGFWNGATESNMEQAYDELSKAKKELETYKIVYSKIERYSSLF